MPAYIDDSRKRSCPPPRAPRLVCHRPSRAAELLLAIHDEVLMSVAAQLPPEMQVLNAALQLADG